MCVSRRVDPIPAQGSQLRRKCLTVWGCSSDHQGQVCLLSRPAKHTCWSVGSRGQWISTKLSGLLQKLRPPLAVSVFCTFQGLLGRGLGSLSSTS